MTKRLFVAIDLPESTRQLLASLDPQIRGVRWIEPTQMHLTLAFFGDVADDIELALREKLGAIEFGAFFLPIVGIGTFPAMGAPKIIWIGVGQALGAPTSVPNLQACAGSRARRWVRAGASSLASTYYDCALPRCLRAIAAEIFAIERGS